MLEVPLVVVIADLHVDHMWYKLDTPTRYAFVPFCDGMDVHRSATFVFGAVLSTTGGNSQQRGLEEELSQAVLLFRTNQNMVVLF